MPTKAKDAAPAKPKPEDLPAKPADAKRPSEPTIATGAKGQPSDLAVAVDPRLAKPDGPKTRPSQPNIAVDPKLKKPEPAADPKLKKDAPKTRPSEPNLAVDPKLKAVVAPKPVPKPKPEPKKPPPKGELPPEWRALVGKPLTCSWRRASGHPIDVIDWAAFPDRESWLDSVFGDCDPAKHFTGLIGRKGAHVEWTSTPMLPVALLGQHHGGEGQLEAVLLIDTTTADSPIFSIEIDGTAVPAKKPQQVAANLAAMKIEITKPGSKPKLDFDIARPKIVSGAIDGDAKKVLQKLSGDRDGGSGYLQEHIEKKPKPPEGRDPRWIEALRDELAKSIVLASDGYQSETHMFAGTLASFGESAIPALVAALETALASYPKQSLNYGVQPVLVALDYLKSDAGVSPALAILSKAKSPEKSYAIPPVLDYLKPRLADERVAPVLKKFIKKATPKKPMHYIAELKALAEQLDI